MKPACLLLSIALFILTVPASAAEAPASPNRFSFAPRFGFGLKADFRDISPSATSNFGPPSGGGVDRFYDNGYVRVDSSGNAGGTTWFWGYESNSQIDLSSDTISFEALQGANGTDLLEVEDDPHPGGEFNYTRLIGSFGGAHLGVEFAANYTDISIESSDSASGTVTRITDTYSLNGITPPGAPYMGSFAGSTGPEIGDSPTRTTTTENLVIRGNRSLDAQIWGIKAGPVLDIPMDDWFSLQLSGGLTALYVDGELGYDESVQFGSNGISQQNGQATGTDWLIGGYVRGQLSVNLSESLMIFGGVELQGSGEYSLNDGIREASMDFNGVLFASGGVTLTF